MPHDDTNPATPATARGRRERSTRYPGVPLAEAIKLVESIERLGVDGLSAADIASALGYKNIKTNTFSAPLSAARQFGLLALSGDGYGLTPLAREILHPVDPDDVASVCRQALVKPPLYAELVERFAGKKVPEASILGNVLYHHHSIIATAKQAAAAAFLESARSCGALGEDNVLHPLGAAAPAPPTVEVAAPTAARKRSTRRARDLDPGAARHQRRPARPRPRSASICDSGTPTPENRSASAHLQTITPASFERFLQTFKLLVRSRRTREACRQILKRSHP